MKKTEIRRTTIKAAEKTARMRFSHAQQRTLQSLIEGPVYYVPHDSFRYPTKMAKIMEWDISTIPVQVLTTEEEQALFLYLNYARYKAEQVRRRLLKRARWLKKDVTELLDWNEKQLNARSKLTSCNLGLVISTTKRVNYPSVEHSDLISEGNMALLRVIDQFDCSRGCKFSTYAYHAIRMSFLRVAKQCYRYRTRFPVQLEIVVERDDHTEVQRAELHQDQLTEVGNIMRNNLAQLSGIELSVVENRFSLGKSKAEPMTLQQVAERLDLSKERIRQIQRQAISKLRQVSKERMAMLLR
jgi:RNA polymerase primary sigma factor